MYTVSGQDLLTPEEVRLNAKVNDYARNCAFGEALKLVSDCRQQTRDKNKTVYWLLKTAHIYYDQSNIKAGDEALDTAESILRQIHHPGHALAFYHACLQGKRLFLDGKPDESLKWMKRAETQASFIRGQLSLELAWFYWETGHIYYEISSYKTALRYFELAEKNLPVYSSLDQHTLYNIMIRKADAYRKIRNLKKCDELVRICFSYIDTVSDPLHPLLFDTYRRLILFSRNIPDDNKTTRMLVQNATTLLERYYPEDHYYAGILLVKKAELEFILSDFEKAYQYGMHAAQILSKYKFLNLYKLANYYNLAWLQYWLKHDYKATISYGKQYLDSIKKTGLFPARLYYLIGLSYLQLNDKQQGIRYMNQVISGAETLQNNADAYYCALAYQQLGYQFLAQNNRLSGRKYLQTALDYALQVPSKRIATIGITTDLGAFYISERNYPKALSYFQQAIIAGCHTFKDTSVYANPPLADIGFSHRLIHALTSKAYAFYLLYETTGQPLGVLEYALSCQELAVDILEKSVIDIEEERSVLTTSGKRSWAMNNAVSYATLLYLKTGDRKYADKAWEYAEKSKMQVLSVNTMKQKNFLYSGLPDSLVRKFEDLLDRIRKTERQLSFEEEVENLGDTQNKTLASLTRLYSQRDELGTRLENEFPAYSRLKYNFTVSGINKVQQILDRDQVIIEYQLLSTEIITFVITKDDYSILFQLIDKEIPVNIEKLRTFLSTNPMQSDPVTSYQGFIESSSFLYKKLIDPIYDKIKGKRLLIVPHDKLTQIPFEVLIREKPVKGGIPDYRSLSFLVSEFPVSYAFSANLLTDNDHKFGRGTAVFLPDYTSSPEGDSLFLSLDGAAAEARTVKRLTGGRLFANKKADESTFKARARRYRILHISSHSLLNVTDPELSYLAMTVLGDTAEDGNLYAYEIARMKLHAQLVVLSGCNTGFGKFFRNEGLISIARSFLYTGIRTVAFTLWPMADKAGSNLVISFYRGIRRHQTLDRALRYAKLGFLEKSDPVMAHPYYWSGYVIAGRTSPVPMFRTYTWFILMASSLTIILLIWLLYKRIKN